MSTTNNPEEKMTNKFLPFIVDSSTPKHIFKTLLSRSKGMNKHTVASIFNLTLNTDIKKLRSLAGEMPEMQLEALYQELLQRYPQHHIDEEVLRYFHDIVYFAPENKWRTEELDEFTITDTMSFLCVLSKKDVDMSEYTKIDWSKLHNFEDILKNFKKYVTFSDTGTTTKFKSVTALKTYVLYCGVLKPQIDKDSPMTPICAVFSKAKTKKKKSGFSQADDGKGEEV